MYIYQSDSTIRIDGFCFTHAVNKDTVTRPDGGGIYVNARRGGRADLTVANCTFYKNKARGGAGVYIDAQYGGYSKHYIENCTFRENRGQDGAGFNPDTSPNGYLETYISNCNF